MSILQKYFPKYLLIGLLYGVILTLLGIFKAFFDSGVHTFIESCTFSVKLFMPLGFIIGITYFYFKEVYAPKKKEVILKKKSFIPFYKNGFELNHNKLEGNYKGFKAYISWIEESPVHYQSPALLFMLEYSLDNEKCKKINDTNNDKYLLVNHEGLIKVDDRFWGVPTYDEMTKMFDELVCILENDRIK